MPRTLLFNLLSEEDKEKRKIKQATKITKYWLKQNKKLTAIKKIKDYTNWGLRDAKEFVDRISLQTFIFPI
jgi:ribosomal protein L7/L12